MVVQPVSPVVAVVSVSSLTNWILRKGTPCQVREAYENIPLRTVLKSTPKASLTSRTPLLPSNLAFSPRKTLCCPSSNCL